MSIRAACHSVDNHCLGLGRRPFADEAQAPSEVLFFRNRNPSSGASTHSPAPVSYSVETTARKCYPLFCLLSTASAQHSRMSEAGLGAFSPLVGRAVANWDQRTQLLRLFRNDSIALKTS